MTNKLLVDQASSGRLTISRLLGAALLNIIYVENSCAASYFCKNHFCQDSLTNKRTAFI